MVKSTGGLALCAIILMCGGCYSHFQQDVEYGEAGGQRLLLDARVPRGEGPFPVVILVHGGGWSSRDKAHEFDAFIEPLTDAGFTTFCINYRLAPQNRWPDCLEDVQTSIRWAKMHAGHYRGDPNRIVLLGHSAGGHLVCLAATIAGEETRVQAVVGLAPPADLVMDCKLRSGGLSKGLQSLTGRAKKLDAGAIAELEEMSPVNHVGPGLPPFLLIQGTNDHAVPHPEVVEMCAKLLGAGDSCEMLGVQGGGHEFKTWNAADPSWFPKMIAWLNQHVGEPGGQ
ncbi:MAG: alpha/beta hydrolase [Tepidisphaeraceae bacterium]